MTDVMINQRNVERIIKDLIKYKYKIYIEDESFIKKALIQLKKLDLIYSSWDKTNKSLYWGLTKKGIRTRDDILLVKK